MRVRVFAGRRGYTQVVARCKRGPNAGKKGEMVHGARVQCLRALAEIRIKVDILLRAYLSGNIEMEMRLK